MNPLTQVKRTQKINSTEAALGISEGASWHAKYKDSAYVFVGGIPYDLTEGDLLAVFAQYGEIVDVNLVRDKATGKSKGFAFLAYEDQRSTILAVDNLNGAKVLDRIVRVDHASNYKKKEEEDEEKEQQKREARGVCRAYQKGECNRGAACRFSHDEQRGANTGWGPKDSSNSTWDHDKYDGPPKSHKNFSKNSDFDALQQRVERGSKAKAADNGGRYSKLEEEYEKRGERRQGREIFSGRAQIEREARDDKQSEMNKSDRNEKEDLDRRSRHDGESTSGGRHRERKR